MAVLEVTNIKKGFGTLDVLKGVSFSLEKGQVLAIIGSSGSGKTTLLRCLNFLETPDEGQICVGGKELTGSHLTEEQIRENRLHFGLVFQNFNLFPQYTVLENITLAPTLLKKGTPGKGPVSAGAGGPQPEEGQLSLAAFRRPAAACGHRPGPGAESGGSVL